MIKDCTLLLNTYDGGEDLWEGFFTALTNQWPEFDMSVVLNTESKSYTFPKIQITSYQLYSNGKKVEWGERLIENLKKIKTEYVLFFLEDFWLDAPVDNEHFLKCLDYMRDNKDVACLSFQRTRGNNIKDGRFERFERRPQNGEYRFNCQAALWRTDRLLRFIRPHESPWEWELYGSIRSRRYTDTFYTLIEGEKKVFSYDLGGVVYRGRWCKKVVLPLQEKYHLSIDYSKRGFFEDYAANPQKRKRSIKQGITNRINIIKSIL